MIINAYQNQARNRPPPRGSMQVGQRISTQHGCGVIMNLVGTFHRGGNSNLDPLIAVILIPGNPPRVINQPYSQVLFTGGMNGEMSTRYGLIQS